MASGPFLESPETFRANFGWHNSLCILKAKALAARNFAVILNCIPGTLRNGPQDPVWECQN